MDSIFWRSYILPLLENPLVQYIIPAQAAADAIETAWQSYAGQSAGFEFQVRAALSQLIFWLTSHMPAAPAPPTEKDLRNDARIKAMLQYIQTHYAEELDIQRIAQSAMVGESECLRCFRQTIGTTPIQYLKQLRISRAAQLLTQTGRKIGDIGAECGFQDVSYFIKAFRAAMGCTPGAYRKNNK